MSSGDSELLAQQVSGLNEKVTRLEQRMAEVERVNSRLEQAALTTARALREISGNWDAVYEAMRRVEKIGRMTNVMRRPWGASQASYAGAASKRSFSTLCGTRVG
jgi:outer membrane murein-binding lipoprotein Lpp